MKLLGGGGGGGGGWGGGLQLVCGRATLACSFSLFQTIFHFQSFETKSLKLVDTKYGNGVLLDNVYMPHRGEK